MQDPLRQAMYPPVVHRRRIRLWRCDLSRPPESERDHVHCYECANPVSFKESPGQHSNQIDHAKRSSPTGR